MTHKEAKEILRKYNEWRRYSGPADGAPELQHPAVIGEAIDVVVADKDNSLPDIGQFGQFRREAAKDILCALCSFPPLGYYKDNVRQAINIADELIKQLREDEQ